MEVIFLVPVIVTVFLLREAGFSWTSIVLIWDVLVYSFFWLVYYVDRKAEDKRAHWSCKLFYAVMTVVMMCLSAVIAEYANGNDFDLVYIALIPVFTAALWFIISVLRDG